MVTLCNNWRTIGLWPGWVPCFHSSRTLLSINFCFENSCMKADFLSNIHEFERAKYLHFPPANSLSACNDSFPSARTAFLIPQTTWGENVTDLLFWKTAKSEIILPAARKVFMLLYAPSFLKTTYLWFEQKEEYLRKLTYSFVKQDDTFICKFRFHIHWRKLWSVKLGLLSTKYRLLSLYLGIYMPKKLANNKIKRRADTYFQLL